jgi:hypothetical protein
MTRPRTSLTLLTLACALLASGCLMTKRIDTTTIEYRGKPQRVDAAASSACPFGPGHVEVVRDRPATWGTANAETTNTTYSTSYGTTYATTTTSSTPISIPIPAWKVVRVTCNA